MTSARTSTAGLHGWLLRLAGTGTLLTAAFVLIGCPSTMFYDEGSGQPGDRAAGKAPPGSVAACKVPNSQRPPIVRQEVWDNMRPCNKRTGRRYLRVGWGRLDDPELDKKRITESYQALRDAASQEDGNVRMLTLLREVQRTAGQNEKLRPRVQRASGRTFACDYAYLFNKTDKAYAKVSDPPDPCPAYVFDPELRRDVCLFDTSLPESRWLTSGWSCLAFTETVGEGASCYRLCEFDDYCASQVSCAQPDFDLVLCALGICMPEKVAGIYEAPP